MQEIQRAKYDIDQLLKRDEERNTFDRKIVNIVTTLLQK